MPSRHCRPTGADTVKSNLIKRRPGRPKKKQPDKYQIQGSKRVPKDTPQNVQKAKESLQRNRLVTVTLTMRHNHRNGQVYGPGKVKIPAILAQELLNTEEYARKVDEQFHRTRGIFIGPRSKTGHITKQAPVETLDDSDWDPTRHEETSEEYFNRVAGKWKPPQPR